VNSSSFLHLNAVRVHTTPPSLLPMPSHPSILSSSSSPIPCYLPRRSRGRAGRTLCAALLRRHGSDPPLAFLLTFPTLGASSSVHHSIAFPPTPHVTHQAGTQACAMLPITHLSALSSTTLPALCQEPSRALPRESLSHQLEPGMRASAQSLRCAIACTCALASGGRRQEPSRALCEL